MTIARKLLDQIVVIDLETTCEDHNIDPKFNNEIIEIGIALLDPQSLEVKSVPSIFVTPPTTTVTPFCTNLTKITPEQVTAAAGAVTLETACSILKAEYKTQKRTWGSWGAFDRKQFERQTTPKTYPFGPSHINIKNLFSLVFNFNYEMGMATALEWSKLPLQGQHHSGKDDAYNTAILLRKIIGWEK